MKIFDGADISTELCGIKLQSPFILSSGPLSYAAEGMIRAHQAGAGAVVTKTIRLSAAINPINHIGVINKDSLINCEKWADSKARVWFEREIPMTKEAGAVVIASVGHTQPEVEAIVANCEKAGADMIEVVSYREEDLMPMLLAAKARVSIPVICKLSANWLDPVLAAKQCIDAWADAISAIDSIGPTLKIDIERARPEMASDDGYGWLSGGAIRPIALRIVSEVARLGCDNLIGIGGVNAGRDAIEYLMVGANAVGVCSVTILRGAEVINQLRRETSVLLGQLGYRSIASVRGVALANFPVAEKIAKLEFSYDPDYAPCQTECPAGVDVPLYMDQVQRGDYLGAYQTVSRTNPFPSICGRACDHPCEPECRRAELDEPLQIRLIKRMAADRTFAACGETLPLPARLPENEKKIAVIGSGPAGLSAAYFLARIGYGVTVFEALPVAGGMLAVGIPDYRLPREPLRKEIARIVSLGVEIRTGVRIGEDLTISDIREEGYQAVIIAAGAHGNPVLDIPGEDLNGVWSGIQFLRDVNLANIFSLRGRRVTILGGGNVAVDSARSALRLGAETVTIVYRRDRESMPADSEEIEAAEAEGVKFIFLAGPDRISGEDRVNSLFYQPMELGDLDSSERRRPLPTNDSPVEVETNMVIIATGQKIVADFLPPIADQDTGRTEVERIYAAGDCLSGPSSIIEAIAAGRRTAEAVDLSLGGSGKVVEEVDIPRVHFIPVADPGTAREESGKLPLAKRLPGFAEVELGLTEEAARKEAARCLHCGCINCQWCVMICPYYARTLDFPEMKVDEDLCRSCGACVSVCPTGALTAVIKEVPKVR
jgi:NADPH-dependent glutamate synthase beta subunit-like oxidoreductase/dihydroorotate dehydrogenase